jgi:hypothetical protein
MKHLHPNYRQIASLLAAINNCHAKGNTVWMRRHEEALNIIMATAPSGSGFDAGTLLGSASTPDKLIFKTSFHHMDDNGGYRQWSDHAVTVRRRCSLVSSL